MTHTTGQNDPAPTPEDRVSPSRVKPAFERARDFMKKRPVGSLYLLAVVVIAGAMGLCRAAPDTVVATPSIPAEGRIHMQWSDETEVPIPAKPAGIWTWAYDDVDGPALIKIEAAAGATWEYAAGKSCGPDGDLGSLVSREHVLVPTAPVGALIAKIGGSTAGTVDGTVHVVGGKAVLRIDDTVRGPIFLSINDELSGFSDNRGEIKVTIQIARVAAPPAAAPSPAKN